MPLLPRRLWPAVPEVDSPASSPGQFTGVVSRSADLERHVKIDELLHSKILSIFDPSALNPSILGSDYQLGEKT